MACIETTSTLIESVAQWKSQAEHKTQQEQQNMDMRNQIWQNAKAYQKEQLFEEIILTSSMPKTGHLENSGTMLDLQITHKHQVLHTIDATWKVL